MWRAIMSSRWAAWVVGFVSVPKARQLQQELDMQKLYVVTQLHKAALKGRVPSMQQILYTSQALQASAVRQDVEALLEHQLLGIASHMHKTLVQGGDAAAPAVNMAAVHQLLQQQRHDDAPGIVKLFSAMRRGSGGRGSGNNTGAAPSGQGTDNATGASSTNSNSNLHASGTSSGTSGSGSTNGSSSSCGSTAMSMEQLAEGLARHTGFRLSLRQSSISHPAAGLGVFVEGEAKVGSIVALVPGVVYARTQLQHMPNYPKVDTDNPYLSCRYDQSIIDSKPWGRGQQQPGGGRWWQWAGPLSSSMRYLEGRHPLALGHYVNHPGQGMHPNVLEVLLDVPLTHPILEASPGLRAYLPNAQPPHDYDPLAPPPERDGPVSSGADGGSSGPGSLAGAHGAQAGAVALAPGELSAVDLFEPPGGVVRMLLMVATRSIKDGEEVLQNYRMNPHVVRPDWYHVYDAEAEVRRWAKVKVVDMGFSKAKKGQ